MIEFVWRLFLFVRDFTGRGADSFYWFVDGQIVETDAEDIVKFSGAIICHDFWMIRDVLFSKTGMLPKVIIDLDEFRISISGRPGDRLDRERHDITAVLEQYGADREVCSVYKRMFSKGVSFDLEVACKVAKALSTMYVSLLEQAKAESEAERYFVVEVPVYRLLQNAMAAGIVIDGRQLSEMRSEAEHNYFMCLKRYSVKHDMPLEMPSRSALEERLRSEGFELDDVSIEYLLEYMPHERDFGSDTIVLQEAENARRVLGSITLSTTIMRPVLDVFGSRTSRIHLRSPSLQNIPKKYRSIVAAHEGAKLSYVDYDQYEVGIMAALSRDFELMKLYAAGDMYDIFATSHLGLSGNRKSAKELFLSYAYGMSKKALIDAAVSLGVERHRAKAAFGLFAQYEAWKKSVCADFQANGRVETLLGNHYKRERSGPLSNKEQRSVVSQVVQGTASLIFKKALLEVGELDDVVIILPMHDALLFEHKLEDTPKKVVTAFENAMTNTLGGIVRGKASVGAFAARGVNVNL